MRRDVPALVIYALFIFSGATGLIYELIWTRELVFVFGGTTYAISTVLVAFMGGLGLGSYLIGRISARFREPGRAYGVLEILIGLYALATPLLLKLALPLYEAIYPHVETRPWPLTAARFAIGSLILLAPTTLMGATLPLLVRFISLRGGAFGRSVALLYGINTTGAVLGVVLSGFVLIPELGLITATRVAAAANVAIGLIAVALLRAPATGDADRALEVTRRERHFEPLSPAVRRCVLLVFAISGFAAMVYQICWSRALVMSMGSSTYCFTCILAAFITGLSLGSYAISPLVDRLRNPVLVIGVCETLIGLAAVAILPVFGNLSHIVYDLVTKYGQEQYERVLLWQFVIIVAVTLPPTFLMGALFPLVTRTVVAKDEDEGAATGRAYGVNTIGTILGSFLAGFVLIRSDVLGVQSSILFASGLNVVAGALLTFLALRGPAPQRLAPALGGVVLTAVLAVLVGRWDPLVLGSGAFQGDKPDWKKNNFDIVYLGEGVDLTVMVGKHKTVPDNLFLAVNAVDNASTGADDLATNMLLGHLPVLLSQRHGNVCIIGLGCGVTLAAVARHKDIQRIDCIEISDEVIRGAREFAPFCYDVLDSEPRVNMLRADGRNHLLLTRQKYDLIISEPSHPWMAGVANLFTREFFELCRDSLADDGRMCLWLHGYGISKDNFRLVVRTLASVFPFVTLWELGPDDYMMIAGRERFSVPIEQFAARVLATSVREDLYRTSLGRVERVLAKFMTSGDKLREWAGQGGLHTDDNAILEFTTPRQVYEDESVDIYQSLRGLAREPFEEVIQLRPGAAADAELRQRTVNVVAARDKRYEAQQIMRKNGLEAFKLLLEAVRLDPGNLEVYLQTQGLIAGLQSDAPAALASEAGRQMMQQFSLAPLPAGGIARGSTLPQIAQQLRGYAADAAQRDLWPLVAFYLREAVELAPGPGLVIELAAAQGRANQVDNAVMTLRRAIEEQILTVDQVRASRPLRFLENQPAFQALVGAPASQPTP